MADDKKTLLPALEDVVPMMPKPAGPAEATPSSGADGIGRVKQKSWTPLGFLPGWAKWGINQTVKSAFILIAHGAWHSAQFDGDLSDFHMPHGAERFNLLAVKSGGTILNDMLVQPAKGEKNPSPFAATNGNYLIPRMREDKNAALGAFSPGNVIAKGWNLMAERAIPCAIYCAIFAAGPAGVPGAIGTFMVTSFMADAMDKVYKGLVAKPLGLA